MRRTSGFLSFASILLLSIPASVAGQACLGRPAQSGQMAVAANYEPQVNGWGGAFDWNSPGMWSFRAQGANVGELIENEKLDTFLGWTKIGSTSEQEGGDDIEYPIVTRRAEEQYLRAEGIVEFVLSSFSICASGGLEALTGSADLNQRIIYLDAIGPRWVRSMQDYAGVRAPMTLSAGYQGLTVSAVDLIPFASFTYWIDRVTFDRVADGFTYEGWYGQGGATVVYGGYSVGLGFRTADDLRDESVFTSLGYRF